VTINRFQRPVTQLLLCHMPLPLLMVRWFAESASVSYSRDFGSGKVHNCVLLETGHYRGASVRWGDRPSSLYHVQYVYGCLHTYYEIISVCHSALL
jgi:hypothetical protein